MMAPNAKDETKKRQSEGFISAQNNRVSTSNTGMSSTPGMGMEPKKSNGGPVTPKPNAVNTKYL
jgi:hypothetical protein